MGSFNVYCEITKVTIDYLDDIVLLPLKKVNNLYFIEGLPIFGKYDSYGRIYKLTNKNYYNIICKAYKTNNIDEYVEKLLNLKYDLDYCFIHKKVFDDLSYKDKFIQHPSINIIQKQFSHIEPICLDYIRNFNNSIDLKCLFDINLDKFEFIEKAIYSNFLEILKLQYKSMESNINIVLYNMTLNNNLNILNVMSSLNTLNDSIRKCEIKLRPYTRIGEQHGNPIQTNKLLNIALEINNKKIKK